MQQNSRPDLLSLSLNQRRSALATGQLDAKKDTQASSSWGNSPMHCDACGTRLLLVYIKPQPTEEHPNRWNGTFWCLNSTCGSFCDDIILLVE